MPAEGIGEYQVPVVVPRAPDALSAAVDGCLSMVNTPLLKFTSGSGLVIPANAFQQVKRRACPAPGGEYCIRHGSGSTSEGSSSACCATRACGTSLTSMEPARAFYEIRQRIVCGSDDLSARFRPLRQSTRPPSSSRGQISPLQDASATVNLGFMAFGLAACRKTPFRIRHRVEDLFLPPLL